MKFFVLTASALCLAMTSFAQTDTSSKKVDTIKVGGITIIKKQGAHGENSQVTFSNHHSRNLSTVVTNWFIPDLGFTNYSDNTNYAAAQQSGFVSPSITNKDNLKLRSGKSVDVNIWIFMQKLNLVKHYINLKYGLGVELNNYHYDDERVRFTKNPTTVSLDPALATAGKNKLAADYVTLPVMFNFNFTPTKRQSFGFSTGMSVGYLYSSRQKIKYNDEKTKLHDDFNLEKWKISYIAELSLGPIHLYGSIATTSMWEKGLDQTPYTVGLRFSKF